MQNKAGISMRSCDISQAFPPRMFLKQPLAVIQGLSQVTLLVKIDLNQVYKMLPVQAGIRDPVAG